MAHRHLYLHVYGCLKDLYNIKPKYGEKSMVQVILNSFGQLCSEKSDIVIAQCGVIPVRIVFYQNTNAFSN